MQIPTGSPGPWLKHLEPCSDARTEIICFPHSGGAASSFRPLAAQAGMRVVGVQYPGRQDRYDEPVLTDLHTLADLIAMTLATSALPRIFFGHSMGAILAYEVAQRLGSAGPAALVVSARPAPSVVRVTANYLLDDDELTEQVVRLGGTASSLFGNSEMREMLLPMIRGDYHASETYVARDNGPLGCPILAIGGVEDPVTSAAELQAWSAHTTGGFRLELLPGGHFYLQDAWPAVAELVRSAPAVASMHS